MSMQINPIFSKTVILRGTKLDLRFNSEHCVFLLQKIINCSLEQTWNFEGNECTFLTETVLKNDERRGRRLPKKHTHYIESFMSRILTLANKIKANDVIHRTPVLFSSRRTILESLQVEYCNDLLLG